MYSSDYDQGCILAKQPIQQWCPPQSKSIYEFRAMLSYKNQFSYMVQSLQLCSPQSVRMHEFRAAQIHGTTHSTVMSCSVREYLWGQSHAQLQGPAHLHGPTPSTVISLKTKNSKFSKNPKFSKNSKFFKILNFPKN